MLPAISVNKACCSHHHATTATPEREPWGNSGYNEQPSLTAASLPHSSVPWGDSGWEAQVTGPRSWGANKGMISGSPDSCIFPYIEKHWVPLEITWDIWFSLITSHLLMFWLPGLEETLIYPGSSLNVFRAVSQSWESVSWALVFSFVC